MPRCVPCDCLVQGVESALKNWLLLEHTINKLANCWAAMSMLGRELPSMDVLLSVLSSVLQSHTSGTITTPLELSQRHCHCHWASWPGNCSERRKPPSQLSLHWDVWVSEHVILLMSLTNRATPFDCGKRFQFPRKLPKAASHVLLQKTATFWRLR